MPLGSGFSDLQVGENCQILREGQVTCYAGRMQGSCCFSAGDLWGSHAAGLVISHTWRYGAPFAPFCGAA